MRLIVVLLVVEQEPTKLWRNSLGKRSFRALTLAAGEQRLPNFAKLNFELVHLLHMQRGLGSHLVQKKSDPVKF